MKIIRHLFILVLFATVLHGKEFCSLTVVVVNSQGEEVEAHVNVREHDGRTIEADNKTGGISVCNLGILPVTVTVGEPSCGQVEVRNVNLTWGEARTIKIVYDRNPDCLKTFVPRTWCQILFRFVDSERKPVEGVTLKLESPNQETVGGDQFGRILLRPGFGKMVNGTAEAAGYIPSRISLVCAKQEKNSEQYIILQKDR